MIKDFLPKLLEGVYAASEKILEIYQQDFEVFYKEDRSPVTLADQYSSKILMECLKETNIPIISEEEEMIPYNERKHYSFLWLIDPIDGTKEFIAKNNEFCICIALIENGIPIFGLIASPTEKKIIYGGKNEGAFEMKFHENNLWEKKLSYLSKENNPQKKLIYSRSRMTEKGMKYIQELEKKYGEIQIIKKGSALKFFDLIKGEVDFYIRFAPTMEWDIAAGQAIYEAVGGEVISLETNKALIYNKEELKNPYFIAKPKNIKLD